MDREELWAHMYQQNHSKINGRNIWHYLLDTAIGHIHIVEYEQKDLSLKRYIVEGSNAKAEKKFDQLSMQMVKGKI